MRQILHFEAVDEPAQRGLYLCRMRDPIRYGLPRHRYAILQWTGDGSAADDPRRWGHPASLRQIATAEVLAWLGPLPDAGPPGDPPAPPPARPSMARRRFAG